MTTPRLVPVSVLPTKSLPRPIGVRLLDGQWESLEGRIVPDTQDAGGERQYPKLGDVLPVVGKVPFYETKIQAERRMATDSTPSMHVALGIDLELLRKAAESLGTTKVTLFVPVPVKDMNKRPTETFVNKPVAICPANKDADGQGIAVVMPLSPENGAAYYTKVRDVIVASELRALNALGSRDRSAAELSQLRGPSVCAASAYFLTILSSSPSPGASMTFTIPRSPSEATVSGIHLPVFLSIRSAAVAPLRRRVVSCSFPGSLLTGKRKSLPASSWNMPVNVCAPEIATQESSGAFLPPGGSGSAWTTSMLFNFTKIGLRVRMSRATCDKGSKNSPKVGVIRPSSSFLKPKWWHGE